MAIFHLSVKTVSRSSGRSATAAAAYRTGEKIADERTGEVHDYRARSGVVLAALVLPEAAPAMERAALWNAAEAAEKRRNSTVAREYQLALPAELGEQERAGLALSFAARLAERFGVAADVAIHGPSRDGDDRNHHAHILTSTRRLGPDGFGEKTRELDDQKTGPALVEEIRAEWAAAINQALERNGLGERIDHRSHERRGLDTAPTVHQGPAATAMERRGLDSDRANDNEVIRATNEQLQAARHDLAGATAEVVGLEDERRKRAEKARQEAQERAEAIRRAEEAERAEKARPEAARAVTEAKRARRAEEIEHKKQLWIGKKIESHWTAQTTTKEAARAAERAKAAEEASARAAARVHALREGYPIRAWLHDRMGMGFANLARATEVAVESDAAAVREAKEAATKAAARDEAVAEAREQAGMEWDRQFREFQRSNQAPRREKSQERQKPPPDRSREGPER